MTTLQHVRDVTRCNRTQRNNSDFLFFGKDNSTFLHRLLNLNSYPQLTVVFSDFFIVLDNVTRYRLQTILECCREPR